MNIFNTRKYKELTKERLFPTVLHNDLKASLREKYESETELKVLGVSLDGDDVAEAYHCAQAENMTSLVAVTRYPRQDGSAVVLCSPVNDYPAKTDDLENRVRGSIRDALTCYAMLRNAASLVAKDVMMIPVCQTAKGRRHFVFMVIQGDSLAFIDSKAKPRSFIYPVEQFFDVLRKMGQEDIYKVKISQIIFTKHQSLFNNYECGHYVKSYALQLSLLLKNLSAENLMSLLSKDYIQSRWFKETSVEADETIVDSKDCIGKMDNDNDLIITFDEDDFNDNSPPASFIK